MQNSNISKSPGLHISICCTLDIRFPGVDFGAIPNKNRQNARKAAQTPDWNRDNMDGGSRGSKSSSAETYLAFGEETGSGCWCKW